VQHVSTQPCTSTEGTSRRAYTGVLDVLGAFCGAGARLGGLVDVPELDPPVKQERVVGHLIRRQLRRGKSVSAVLVQGLGAVGPVAGAGLLGRAGRHLDRVAAIEHGPGELEVAVAQEVVIDVRVELLARIRGHALVGVGVGVGGAHGGHHGRAVDRAVACVHSGDVGHLLALHRDAGAGGVLGVGQGGGERRGGRGDG